MQGIIIVGLEALVSNTWNCNDGVEALRSNTGSSIDGLEALRSTIRN